MALDAKKALAASKKYTDDSLEGVGAIAGKPCQVQSITDITGGKRVTFLWLDNSGNEHTSTMDVMNGLDGQDGRDGQDGQDGRDGTDGLGIKSVDVNELNHLIVTYDDDTTHDAGEIQTGGGSGEVISVNGKKGVVVLEAADVGALPDDTEIPAKTSDLDNDSDFVSDANYVHTDNNYDDTAKGIVDGVTTELGNKVDKVAGKGLSKNDYTDEDKAIVGGVTSALAGKADADDVYTKTEADALLDDKQDELTFDSAPQSGGTNPVTSGGIYTAIENAKTPVATTLAAGKVKPDGTSITIDPDGTIHSAGGGSGATIYGYKVNKNDSNPATRVTYTDDAKGFSPMALDLTTGEVLDYGSWKDTFIMDAFRPVMLYNDAAGDALKGTVAYELDHDDQTKKLDGTASDISDTTFPGNAMVGVKPIWICRYEDANQIVVKFANKKVDEGYKCYANLADDGETILEEVYTDMFEGSNVSNKVRSLAGQTPMNNAAGATEISYCQANGDGWYLNDWALVKLWEDIAYLFGKNTNAQAVFGAGHNSGGTGAASLLQTGTLKDKGPFYGTSGNVAVKFLWKENAWGDRWDRIAGCMNVSGTIRVKMHPPYNTDASGYVNTGITPGGTSGGYISAAKMTSYGLIPQTASGSDSTYWPDGLWFNNSQTDYAFAGGSCNVGALVGPSCLYLDGALSGANWHIGPSLSYKKPVAA